MDGKEEGESSSFEGFSDAGDGDFVAAKEGSESSDSESASEEQEEPEEVPEEVPKRKKKAAATESPAKKKKDDDEADEAEDGDKEAEEKPTKKDRSPILKKARGAALASAAFSHLKPQMDATLFKYGFNLDNAAHVDYKDVQKFGKTYGFDGQSRSLGLKHIVDSAADLSDPKTQSCAQQIYNKMKYLRKDDPLKARAEEIGGALISFTTNRKRVSAKAKLIAACYATAVGYLHNTAMRKNTQYWVNKGQLKNLSMKQKEAQ